MVVEISRKTLIIQKTGQSSGRTFEVPVPRDISLLETYSALINARLIFMDMDFWLVFFREIENLSLGAKKELSEFLVESNLFFWI